MWINQGLVVQAANISKNTNQILENLVIIICVILVGIIAVLLINVKKRMKIEHMMKDTQDELKKNYKELEATYEIVNNTQKKLSQKYAELKESEAKNRILAYTDHLTELPNRNAFLEQLEEMISNLGKEDEFAVIYIDLDNFKDINDTLGHPYGDELLIDLTYRLKDFICENDFLARVGGDSFGIATTIQHHSNQFDAYMERLQCVFKKPFVLASKEMVITASMGITIVPLEGMTTEGIMKNADTAMYNAKELGKNRYCYYDDRRNRKLIKSLELQLELRNAIDNQEFVVYYQPQIALDSDRIAGFEALVRWNHPTKGIIAPGDFVPLAEETGLIIPIGKWVLFEACRQLKIWQDKGFTDINMAVNFSARQFRDVDIVALVSEAIKETEINPINLEVEITESIALQNIDFTIQTIENLRRMGVQVSLDDFGTGYSSMNYLKLLPVSNLKIDKSFLDAVLDNNSDKKIVSMIIELAQTLNLVVIAEGVELNEQADFLKVVHCNKAQGYLYSRPISDEEAQSFLDRVYENGLKVG